MFWVLGIKTEGVPTVASTIENGRTEILGGWIYVIGAEAPTGPLFRVKEAESAFAGIVHYHVKGLLYKTLVEVTMGATCRDFTRAENEKRANIELLSTRAVAEETKPSKP